MTKARIAITVFLGILLVSGLACGGNQTQATPTPTLIQTAKDGDTVKVLYTGTLDDGTVFDSSELHGGEPLEFTVGTGQVIPGFDTAVLGMRLGESKTVHIPADEAYGPLEVVMERDQFSDEHPPELGQQYQVTLENGRMIVATVTEVSESSVTLENTHHLAGEDLNFRITLVDIL